MIDVTKIHDKVVALHVTVLDLIYQPKRVDDKGNIIQQKLYVKVMSRLSRHAHYFVMLGKMADNNAFYLHFGKMVSIIAEADAESSIFTDKAHRVRTIMYGPDSEAVQSQRPEDWNVWGSEGQKEFAAQLKDTRIRIETGYQGSSDFGNATVLKLL